MTRRPILPPEVLEAAADEAARVAVCVLGVLSVAAAAIALVAS